MPQSQAFYLALGRIVKAKFYVPICIPCDRLAPLRDGGQLNCGAAQAMSEASIGGYRKSRFARSVSTTELGVVRTKPKALKSLKAALTNSR